MKHSYFYIFLLSLLLVGCNGHQAGDLSLSGDCLVDSIVFDGQYPGLISLASRTIQVEVPEDYHVDSMCVTYLSLSDGATSDLSVGEILCLHESRVLTVHNGDVYLDWTISTSFPVIELTSPKALFVSQANSKSGLNSEERAACDWMLSNISESMYASITDFRKGTIDLSQCRVIWWHFHKDGGVDGRTAFESNAADAILAVDKFQSFIDGGGALLLTRYATYLPAYLKINGNAATSCVPNNCWGGVETSPETTPTPWYFLTDTLKHPLYTDLTMGTEPQGIYCCDAGYGITNSTAQWHIGSDWGGYSTVASFEQATGATALGQGSDGAVVVWEFSRSTTGPILCIGSGCYDWYNANGDYSGFHSNINQMTLNAFNYLTK